MKLFFALVATSLFIGAVVCTDPVPPPPVAPGPTVRLCEEYHGFAGESTATFTLMQSASLTGSQRFVLYARGLSSESSVQLEIDGQRVTPDEPYVTSTLPSNTKISIIKRSLDTTPFTSISYLANSEECRLPLDESHLAIPLPVVDGTPANVYFHARPKPPFNFFSLEVSGNQRVNAVYVLDSAASSENAVSIPMNTLVSGVTPATSNGVYVAARGAEGAVDVARFSIAWSVPPPGWSPADGASPDGVERPSLARESGSFLADLLLLLIFGFAGYMVARSVYNYRALNIRTYPEYIPHHETFSNGFEVVKRGFDTAKGKVNLPTAGIPGVGTTFAAGGQNRRGYETVGSVQP